MWKKRWSLAIARVTPLRLISSLQNGLASLAADDLIQDFTAYCYQRDLPRAMKALDLMQNNNLFADCVTYSELIKCCMANRAISHGKTLHQHICSQGYEPKTFVLNSLLNMYVKFGLLQEAQALFDEMPGRNVVSWSTIIWAYASNPDGYKDKALKLLVLMLRDGVRPNMYTYSSILRACDSLLGLRPIHASLLKVGLESDVYVRSSLIDAYSKLGKLTSALGVFNEMVTRDLVVWNSIIAGFAQNDSGDYALHLYKTMRCAGFSADESTLISVLRACTGLALLELGTQVHVHIIKYDQDLALNNALLDMYCKCGSFGDADNIFNRMVEKDVISWSTMILGFAQNGFSHKALGLFEAMNLSCTKPNNITILGVLFACSHAGLVEDGLFYFHSMRKLFGIDPEREHYGCMVDLLGRAGKLDEAVKLIHEMPLEADAVTWRALLGACWVHRNTDLAAYAAEQVLRHDPNDPGIYILLSNIYAKSQRWDEVSNLRNAMRQKRIDKEPGCSWIEIDKHIHAFIVGDSSHPEISSIKRELKKVIRRLQEVGYFPDTNYVLQDIEGEQMEESLIYHSEKLAIVFGLMKSSGGKTIRIRKNLRICGDCHVFAKLLTKMTTNSIVIRDPIRYHHFHGGLCSCGDYW